MNFRSLVELSMSSFESGSIAFALPTNAGLPKAPESGVSLRPETPPVDLGEPQVELAKTFLSATNAVHARQWLEVAAGTAEDWLDTLLDEYEKTRDLRVFATSEAVAACGPKASLALRIANALPAGDPDRERSPVRLSKMVYTPWITPELRQSMIDVLQGLAALLIAQYVLNRRIKLRPFQADTLGEAMLRLANAAISVQSKADK